MNRQGHRKMMWTGICMSVTAWIAGPAAWSLVEMPSMRDFVDTALGLKADVTGAWTEVTPAAPWLARDGMAAVSLGGELWLLGGNIGRENFLNDVWRSADGATWSQALAAAPWAIRERFGATVLNGKMWILGGFDDALLVTYNDVWSSPDGITWTQATAAAPWSGRSGHATLAFGNKLWVLGGLSLTEIFNDVWFSPDGVTWSEITASAPWEARTGHMATTFNGKMWLMGGRTEGTVSADVWSSEDGTTWTQVLATAPWGPRFSGAAVSLDGLLWVYGGTSGVQSQNVLNDVWFSPDGVNWTQQTASAPWSPRRLFASTTHAGKIWVMGGFSSTSFKKDVYSLTITVPGGCGCVGGTLSSSPPASGWGDALLLVCTGMLLIITARRVSRIMAQGVELELTRTMPSLGAERGNLL